MERAGRKLRKNPRRQAAMDKRRGKRKRYCLESEEDDEEIGDLTVLKTPAAEAQSNTESNKEYKPKTETGGCGSDFCAHYISLIEEKARNHKLSRKLEEMEERILCLEELLQEQNLPVTYIKQEVEEEEEPEEEFPT